MVRRFAVLALMAVGLAGCSDQTVRVGEPGQKGIVVRDIERSRSVANDVSHQVRDGDKVLEGE